MGAMLVTISAIAQVTPMVLGDKHAMLRVDEKSKYILLPVQETEEIAAIAVLDGSNNMVQSCLISSFMVTAVKREL